MADRIHILGICGTFMGGLAILARQLGFEVTGSDQNVYYPMSEMLAANQIEILTGYTAENLQPRPDHVIIGNVCSRGNAAVEYVFNEKIPFSSGPEWLAQHILRDRHVLAVSGTHGKTTTTSMLAWILTAVGLNPGYLIGGVANNFSHTAYLGQTYFVIEADEYDTAFFDKRPKFLHYFPRTLILNNIEFDHADIYADIAAIKNQFHLLVKTVPQNGLILYPEFDANINEVLAKGVWSSTNSFIGKNSKWQAKLNNAAGSVFEVYFDQVLQGTVEWGLFGQHNIENALAAIAAAKNVGISPSEAIDALCQFKGVKRRLEIAAQANGITLYDDFAHHPTAIGKTLKALRAKVGNKPITAVLQFASNTMKVGAHDHIQMAAAFNEANNIILLKPNFDVTELCRESKQPINIFDSVEDIVKHLSMNWRREDQILLMSNKSFDGLRHKLIEKLQGAKS